SRSRVEAPVDASAIAYRPDASSGAGPERIEALGDRVRGNHVGRPFRKRIAIHADILDRKVIQRLAKAPADFLRSRMGGPERERSTLSCDGVVEGLGHFGVDVTALAETSNRGARRQVSE